MTTFDKIQKVINEASEPLTYYRLCILVDCSPDTLNRYLVPMLEDGDIKTVAYRESVCMVRNEARLNRAASDIEVDERLPRLPISTRPGNSTLGSETKTI